MRIVIATHGQDDRKQNPRHTKKGLEDIRINANLLYQIGEFAQILFDFQLIIVGIGTRFAEIDDVEISGIFHVKRKKSLVLGSGIWQDDHSQKAITPEGLEIPFDEYISLSKIFSPIIFWEFFMKRKIDALKAEVMVPKDSDVLLLSGRGFLRDLGVKEEHYSNRVYVADPNSRTIGCLIENGQLLKKLRPVAVDIGPLTEFELSLWHIIPSGFR